MRLTSLLLLLLGVSVRPRPAQTQQGTTQDGESLYAERCAKCHESGVPRAANREALRRLAPDAIRLALTTGSMRDAGRRADASADRFSRSPPGAYGPGQAPRLATTPARRALLPPSRMRSIAPGGTAGAPTCRSTDSSRQRWRSCRPIKFRG